MGQLGNEAMGQCGPFSLLLWRQMSILNDLLNTAQMGEPDRLDNAFAENAKLRAQVEALISLLQSKGIVSEEEAQGLRAEAGALE
jgi:hypothetical protein